MYCLSRATGPPAQLVASLRVQADDRASLGKGGPDAPLAVQRQAVRQAVFWIVGGNLPAAAEVCTSEAAKPPCSQQQEACFPTQACHPGPVHAAAALQGRVVCRAEDIASYLQRWRTNLKAVQ